MLLWDLLHILLPSCLLEKINQKHSYKNLENIFWPTWFNIISFRRYSDFRNIYYVFVSIKIQSRFIYLFIVKIAALLDRLSLLLTLISWLTSFLIFQLYSIRLSIFLILTNLFPTPGFVLNDTTVFASSIVFVYSNYKFFWY